RQLLGGLGSVRARTLRQRLELPELLLLVERRFRVATPVRRHAGEQPRSLCDGSGVLEALQVRLLRSLVADLARALGLEELDLAALLLRARGRRPLVVREPRLRQPAQRADELHLLLVGPRPLVVGQHADDLAVGPTEQELFLAKVRGLARERPLHAELAARLASLGGDHLRDGSVSGLALQLEDL